MEALVLSQPHAFKKGTYEGHMSLFASLAPIEDLLTLTQSLECKICNGSLTLSQPHAFKKGTYEGHMSLSVPFRLLSPNLVLIYTYEITEV